MNVLYISITSSSSIWFYDLGFFVKSVPYCVKTSEPDRTIRYLHESLVYASHLQRSFGAVVTFSL